MSLPSIYHPALRHIFLAPSRQGNRVLKGGHPHTIIVFSRRIITQETQDGRLIVRFLIDAMQGQLPDFRPCHRLSAAKELLQRGFDYLPDDADAQKAAEPEPVELTPEELAAQRRAELIEFSKHGPVYYQNDPFPCVCEDRLHECEGNVLEDADQLEAAARRSPTMEYLIRDPDQLEDFLARYAEYLIG